MTSLIVKSENAYTDDDFDAVEKTRIDAALNRAVNNSDVLKAVMRLEAKLDDITSAVKYVVDIAEQVKDQATPTLDAITSSPMFKMIVGKVKK